MKSLRSKLAVTALVVIVLLFLLWRPGAYRLRTRISTSIGSALGRRVTLDNVRVRLLPQPGFDLEGLVIYDDPAFSAEPMIRAEEVSAVIRLRSLFRGRIEIANLSATEPSINLVRNGEGKWNLAALIERNAQIPAAPTAKSASERRPAFPYLEASNARINFKIGQTKKSYALLNADVALWQESENAWGARLKAEPVRTDFHLTDTGLVRINAAWQRAASLNNTPLQVTAEWQNGQLGQITQLLTGTDRGWRGALNVDATISGTPEALRIETRASVEDFHRYDIVESANLRLATSCSGQYNAVESVVSGLLCDSPVKSGTLRLRGNFSAAATPPVYDLRLTAAKIAMQDLMKILRAAKKQLPADLDATGIVNAEFHFANSLPSGLKHSPLPLWTGSGAATDVRFFTGGNPRDAIVAGTVPLTLTGMDTSQPADRRIRNAASEQLPAEPHLRIGPVALSLSGSAPVMTGGWVSAARYRFFLRGDMTLKTLFRLQDVAGIGSGHPAAEGAAKIDVSASGPWTGFAPPLTLGSAQIRDVRAEVPGFNTPIEIGSAAISLTPGGVNIEKIVAHTGVTHWNGEAVMPRLCSGPECSVRFDLSADQLSTTELAEWFLPQPAKRPWYRILSSATNSRAPSALHTLRAHGTLHIGQFAFRKATASQITSNVLVEQGTVTLSGLRGQILQGAHEGDWVIDASSYDPPKQALHYHGVGTLRNISLDQVGALMNDAWISGRADGKFELDGSGSTFVDLLGHADGSLQFEMRNGGLPRIGMPGSGRPQPVHRFTGDLRFKQGVWELSSGRLESRDGFYVVGGKVSEAGLDLVLTRGDQRVWNLTGPLARPHIAPAERADTKATQPKAGQ